MEEERCLFGGMLCCLYMCACSVEHVVQHTVHVRMITQWITILNKNSQSTQLQGRWGPMPPLQLPSWAEWSLLQASPHSTRHSFQGMSMELTQSVPAIKRFSSTWHTYLYLPPSPFLSVPPFPSLLSQWSYVSGVPLLPFLLLLPLGRRRGLGEIRTDTSPECPRFIWWFSDQETQDRRWIECSGCTSGGD